MSRCCGGKCVDLTLKCTRKQLTAGSARTHWENLQRSLRCHSCRKGVEGMGGTRVNDKNGEKKERAKRYCRNRPTKLLTNRRRPWLTAYRGGEAFFQQVVDSFFYVFQPVEQPTGSSGAVHLRTAQIFPLTELIQISNYTSLPLATCCSPLLNVSYLYVCLPV